MEWVESDKWERWFAWHKVFIPGILGKTPKKIVWLKFVERKRILNSGFGSIGPYITYRYREIK